ncbi:potassium channel family protein [Notoacmeibacter ruber]|uniref:Two pore domain potassium channel family protein n=1 Tax=Notoacmeibacter ruber TaxID=2670375 RepID=A0A3L7JAZ1_9HYPH|nr:potassium channel family protein [Notoacmeibacter ruber]RLQ87619.1 two pore domain potassium channel family protein [Notoacmeibacter ruber]
MFANLSLGTAIIGATVLLHTVGLMLLTGTMTVLIRWFRLHKHRGGKTGAMLFTVLGLFAVHTAEVWLWAFAYLMLGASPSFESALYFSTTTFSTLGYGDLILPSEWRLLGALEGINGFLLIGWSTAYLVAASTRHGPFRMGEHF